MWKPGTPKPPVESKELAKTPKNTKRLSGSTMGMRFMQKQNISSPASSLSSPRPHQENNDKAFQEIRTASNSDMYGVLSDLIGRRSFGGFKKPVDNNWQACLRGKEEDITQKISDEELLKRYSESRLMEETKLKKGRKRKSRSNGVSEKRRK
mmetsp:Transcript_18321/g.27781  ORF Transcript_18321/g.27781 Transcript_18321/m.27781 type:complete len:152 (-) Transcript_18321:318-773(-)